MPMIRIVLLLVLGGLTLLLTQNWFPVLPLVFLGIKTQAHYGFAQRRCRCLHIFIYHWFV